MGYYIHIVRVSDWDDYEEESNITLQEWLEYIKTDCELELTNGYLIKIPGSDKTEYIPGFCNWNGAQNNHSEYQPWFVYNNGKIQTKNPDDETLKKMIEIAKKLNARVQGDEFEFYDETYFIDNPHVLSYNSTSTIKKPWWEFW